MASTEVIDLERLLADISEDAPAGEEFRATDATTFYEIKRLRDHSRKAETQFVAAAEASPDQPIERLDAEWEKVFELSEEAVAGQSKDLQVTAWMIESMVRLHGFSGLRDGFRLVREMCEKFWDGIHPRPDDEDGAATTVAPLTGLNGADADGPLIWAINRVPVTNGSSEGPFAIWEFFQTHELDKNPELREQRLQQGWISRQMFEAAAAETSADFFRTLLDDIAQCRQELAELDTTLNEKCGKDDSGFPLAPPTSRIRETLEDAQRTVRGIAKDVLGDEAIDDESEEAAADSDADGTQPAVGKRGIQTREDAFKTLMDVAHFFKKAEPHSPVPYALEQVVRWGKMSLPDLLTELIRDSSSRDDMFRQVGISQSSDQANDSED